MASLKKRQRATPEVTYEDVWAPPSEEEKGDGTPEDFVTRLKARYQEERQLSVDGEAGATLRGVMKYLVREILNAAVYNSEQRAAYAPKTSDEAKLCDGKTLESRDVSMAVVCDPELRKLLVDKNPERPAGVSFGPTNDAIANVPRLPMPDIDQRALEEVKSVLDEQPKPTKKKATKQ